MHVIQMPGKIIVVADDVIIETLLPKRPGAIEFLETPCHIPFESCDQIGKSGFRLGKQYPVEMVMEYDMRDMAKRIFGLGPSHGL